MSIRIDLSDVTLFGNDAGEDENESVLLSYFVDQVAFADFLEPGNRLWIANGRKGTGKSALLVRFAHALRTSNEHPKPLVVHVVPSQLVALNEPPATDNHILLENYWKQVICAAINMELARNIGFAWTDNQMALVESAEVAGFGGRNLVGALLARLVGKISVGGSIELAARPQPAANHEQLLGRIRHEDRLRRPVWFLLDDLDAKYQNSAAQQAFISSFFSAARHLVKQSSGIGIRATVRTDVWASLTAAEDMDKVEQYRTEIVWSANQQKAMLANRVLAYFKRNEPESGIARAWTTSEHADALIECAFVARMKWGQSHAPAEHVVRVLGGGRPRWIAQLCRMAGVNAARDGKDRIAVHHITQAMGEFGRRRLSDLYKEHHYQFADLHRLVESFGGGPRRYATAELVRRIEDRYVAPTGAARIPSVDGSPFRDSLQIARLLYKCGFINGNNAARARLAMPEFVTYDGRPDLLEADTNLDDGMVWEVHPAYRNSLQIR